MNLKAILLISASVFVGLAALLSLAVVNRPPSTLEQAVADQQAKEFVAEAMAAGCTMAGMNDERLGPALAQSRGMVCFQILAPNIGNNMDGKGECKRDDKRCLFTIGYAITKMRALGEMPSDLGQLQEEIDSAFEKLNSTKEKQ